MSPTRTEREILADVKKLALEYSDRTGKPLGVTGEVAEYEAAEKLGLELVEARQPGYDALRRIGTKVETIQIKGRRIPHGKPLRQGRIGKIDLTKPFDRVALVLMDDRYDVLEIWEASRDGVAVKLRAPGSKSRNERGALGISQFCSVAHLVWSKGKSNIG